MPKHHSKEHRSQVVADWRASGLSQTRFCLERGVAKVNLGRWLQREASAQEPVTFARALPPERTPASGVVIEIGAVRLRVERGFDGELLREIAAALGGRRT